VGTHHIERQKPAETRRLRLQHLNLAAMTAVGLEAALGQSEAIVAELRPP
jgi:hypothetical protein